MKLWMRRLSAFVCLGLLIGSTWVSGLAASQSLVFMKTWGGPRDDVASGIAIDSSGYIYVVGTTGSYDSSYSKVVVLKFTRMGDLMWSETWGGNNSDAAHALTIDSQGYIYVVGETQSFSSKMNAFILKYNSSGALVWQRSWVGYGVSQAFAIAADPSGGVYVGGFTSDPTRNDAFLLKLNSTTASLMWQRIYNESSTNVALGLAFGGDGHVYVTGRSAGAIPEDLPLFLAKYDSSGTPIWARIWKSADCCANAGNALDVSASNDVFVAGATATGALLLKFNASGYPIWDKVWGASGDTASGLAIDPFGDVYVAGTTASYGSGGSDAFLLKFDAAGSLLLQRTWGGAGSDDGVAVALDNSSYPLLAGDVREAPPYNLGSPNFKVSSPSFGGISFIQGMVNASYLAQTPNGDVTAVTGSMTYAGGSDVFLLKYNPLSVLATSPYLPLVILFLIVPLLRARTRAKSHSPQYSAD